LRSPSRDLPAALIRRINEFCFETNAYLIKHTNIRSILNLDQRRCAWLNKCDTNVHVMTRRGAIPYELQSARRAAAEQQLRELELHTRRQRAL
jgi:hypothetical protein